MKITSFRPVSIRLFYWITYMYFEVPHNQILEFQGNILTFKEKEMADPRSNKKEMQELIPILYRVLHGNLPSAQDKKRWNFPIDKIWQFSSYRPTQIWKTDSCDSIPLSELNGLLQIWKVTFFWILSRNSQTTQRIRSI